MPGNARLNKPSLAPNVSDQEKAKHSPPEQQNNPVMDRRTHSRRSGEAAVPIEDAMDVALGTEGELWDRRRSRRGRDRRAA